MATAFARDYHMRGEIASTSDGRILGAAGAGARRPRRVQRHRAALEVPGRVLPHRSPAPTTCRPRTARSPACTRTRHPAAWPTRARSAWPRRPTSWSASSTCWPASCRARPGRAADAQPAAARAVPVPRAPPAGSTTPATTRRALRLALDIAGYEELRAEQARAPRERGEYLGIGISFFTEAVGAGPRKHMDIARARHGRRRASCGCTRRGKAVLRISVQSQGQGHETTFAQIVAHELGIGPDDVEVVHGDTDLTPFGLGTYGSRSTPVSGAAASVAAQKVREQGAADRVGDAGGRPRRSGVDARPLGGARRPGGGRVAARDRLAAHSDLDLPDGLEGHLDASCCVQPAEPDVSRSAPTSAWWRSTRAPGKVAVRRFVAVDDCGVRINPTIVEGQVHGGLADGDRHGADGADGVRLRRQLPRRVLHGLPAADGAGLPVLGARGDGDALAAPSARAPRGSASRATVGSPAAVVNAVHGRARAVRGAARRHAADPGRGVVRHPGPPAAARPGDRVEEPDDDRVLDPDVDDLRSGRTPFVLATVVRAERPTSAKPGDRALVLPDGSMEGFVGWHVRGVDRAPAGLAAAARPASRRCCGSRRRAESETVGEGLVTVGNPCLSGGSLDIFLEAMLPPMLVHVHGDAAGGPRARGHRPRRSATTCAARSSARTLPGRPRRAGRGVARPGRGAGAARRRCAAEVPYVGLVASRRRGAGGARVAGRRRRAAGAGAHPGRAGHRRADPGRGGAVGVRGGHQHPGPAAHADAGRAGGRGGRPGVRHDGRGERVTALSLVDGGRTVYFCGPGCRQAYAAAPESYGTSP